MPKNAIRVLENQIGQNLKQSNTIQPALQDLKTLGYTEETKGKQNLVFTALLHARPKELRQILSEFPWLLSEKNQKTAYENLSAAPASIEQAKRKAACWLEVDKLFPFKKVVGHGKMLRNVLKSDESCVEFFDRILPTVNLLECGQNNKTLIHEICGDGRENLEPLNGHILAIRAGEKDERVIELLDAEQAKLAELRLIGSKRGSYGDNLLALKVAGGGWISEDGAFIAASGYYHIEALQKALPDSHPVAQWLAPRAEALDEYIKEKQVEFFESCTPGEHPEAHRIEIWADDQQSQFRQMLGKFVAERGWIRLHRTSYMGLCAEGLPDALQKYKPDIELLATTMGERLPVNYTPYKGTKVRFDLPDYVVDPDIPSIT